MNRISRSVLGVLAVAGIGVSLYLTLFHFRILSDPNFQSACKFSETLDCDKVNTSIYAKVWGIPLGLYGFAFYAVILALVGFSFSAGEKFSRALELIFGLSLLAVGLSAVLAYISAFKIGAWCVFCMSLYAINLLLVVVSYSAAGGGLRAIIGRLDRELAGFYRSPMIYVSVLVFAGITLLGGGVYKDKARAAQDVAVNKFVQEQVREQKKPDAAVGAAAHETSSSSHASDASADSALQPDTVELQRYGWEPVRGKDGAPVTIVVFSDFQCPYCQAAAFALDEVAKRNPGQVAVIYKQYPLDSDCNPYLPRPMHEFACEAAIASKCAHRQGEFWEMHDMMFQHQSELQDSDLTSYARNIGLDMNAYNTCMQDRNIILELARDIDQGKAIPISGTPSIFVNGRKWKGAADPEALSRVVQELANGKAALSK